MPRFFSCYFLISLVFQAQYRNWWTGVVMVRTFFCVSLWNKVFKIIVQADSMPVDATTATWLRSSNHRLPLLGLNDKLAQPCIVLRVSSSLVFKHTFLKLWSTSYTRALLARFKITQLIRLRLELKVDWDTTWILNRGDGWAWGWFVRGLVEKGVDHFKRLYVSILIVNENECINLLVFQYCGNARPLKRMPQPSLVHLRCGLQDHFQVLEGLL